MKILVVDDDLIARTQLAAAVQRAGHVALRASDGQRAWNVLEDNADIGMLITDLGMPVLGGDALLRMVRASRDLQRLPVVVVTVGSALADAARLHQMGANEVLEKPIDMAKVAAAIEGASRKASAKTVDRGAERAAEGAAAEPVFSRSDLLERMGGDEVLAHDVVGAFLIEYERTWAELERAMSDGDGPRTVALLHRLKGSLVNVSAPRAARAAAEAEAAFKAGQPSSATVRALISSLSELQRVLRGIERA